MLFGRRNYKPLTFPFDIKVLLCAPATPLPLIPAPEHPFRSYSLGPLTPPPSTGVLFPASRLTSGFYCLSGARRRNLWLPACPAPTFGHSQRLLGAQLPSCTTRSCCWKGETGGDQPEMPQEGAQILLFHNSQLPPTPSTSGGLGQGEGWLCCVPTDQNHL